MSIIVYNIISKKEAKKTKEMIKMKNYEERGQRNIVNQHVLN